MHCGAVIYHGKSSPSLPSCNRFHPQPLPCVNATISLNKRQHEVEMFFICGGEVCRL